MAIKVSSVDYRTTQANLDSQLSAANTFFNGKTVKGFRVDDERAIVVYTNNAPTDQVLFDGKILLDPNTGQFSQTLVDELETEMSGRDIQEFVFIEGTVIYSYK